MSHAFFPPLQVLETDSLIENAQNIFQKNLQTDDGYFAIYDFQRFFRASCLFFTDIHPLKEDLDSEGGFYSHINSAILFKDKENFLSFSSSHYGAEAQKYIIDKDSLLDSFAINKNLTSNPIRNKCVNAYLFKSSYFRETVDFLTSYIPTFIKKLYFTHPISSDVYSTFKYKDLVLEKFCKDMVNANIISQEALDRYRHSYPSNTLPSAIFDFFVYHNIYLSNTFESSTIAINARPFAFRSSVNKMEFQIDDVNSQNYLEYHYKKLFSVAQFNPSQYKSLFNHMIPTTDSVIEDKTLSLIYQALPLSKDSEKDKFMSQLLSKKLRVHKSHVLCQDSIKYIRNIFNFDRTIFEKFLVKQCTTLIPNSIGAHNFFKHLSYAVPIQELTIYKEIISTCNDVFFQSQDLSQEDIIVRKNLTAFEYQLPVNKIVSSFLPDITIQQGLLINFFETYLKSVFKLLNVDVHMSVKPSAQNTRNSPIINNHHLIFTLDETVSLDKALLNKFVHQFWAKTSLFSLNKLNMADSDANTAFLENFARENYLHHKLMLNETSPSKVSNSKRKI